MISSAEAMGLDSLTSISIPRMDQKCIVCEKPFLFLPSKVDAW